MGIMLSASALLAVSVIDSSLHAHGATEYASMILFNRKVVAVPSGRNVLSVTRVSSEACAIGVERAFGEENRKRSRGGGGGQKGGWSDSGCKR